MFKIYGPVDTEEKHVESKLFAFVKYAGILALGFYAIVWLALTLSEYCWSIV